MARATPLRQQYLDIKADYPDCILFFRLGDFYETFDEDAEVAARALDLTLTSRPVSPGKNDSRIPMAGVPHHALENYIARLIDQGFHVAVCDQVGEAPAKGIIERKVSRVVTPGTVIEPELLSEDRPNYLLALLPDGDAASGSWEAAGLAWVDISTGEFAATRLDGEHCAVLVLEELARLAPREVLLPESWAQRGVTLPEGIHLSTLQDWRFEHSGGHQALCSQFGVKTLAGFGLEEKPQAVCAAGAILHYLRKTRRDSLAQLTGIRVYETSSFMVLDTFTRRNLELTGTLRGGQTRGSLLEVLDRTVTAMGARRLRMWISQPLLQPERIQARLDAVETLAADAARREALVETLRKVADIERLANRLLIGRAGPRDVLALRTSLLAVPRLRTLISNLSALQPLVERLDPCEEVAGRLRRPSTKTRPPRSTPSASSCPATLMSWTGCCRPRARPATGSPAWSRLSASAPASRASRSASTRSSATTSRSASPGKPARRRNTSAARPWSTPSATSRPNSRSMRRRYSAPKSRFSRWSAASSTSCVAAWRRPRPV